MNSAGAKLEFFLFFFILNKHSVSVAKDLSWQTLNNRFQCRGLQFPKFCTHISCPQQLFMSKGMSSSVSHTAEHILEAEDIQEAKTVSLQQNIPLQLDKSGH